MGLPQDRALPRPHGRATAAVAGRGARHPHRVETRTAQPAASGGEAVLARAHRDWKDGAFVVGRAGGRVVTPVTARPPVLERALKRSVFRPVTP